MKVIRHAGVDSRMIILHDQAWQQLTLHFQLSLQCNVSLITGFVRHTAKKKKKNVATYILVQLHLQHTTFDQWGGRKMSVTQCHAQVTNQTSYTINSSRCLIRECQTGLKEDPESTLYILLVLMYTLSLIFLSFHLFDLSTMCAASQSTLWFVFIQWVALVSVHHLWPLLALFCVH